jgi:hypothetical protein
MTGGSWRRRHKDNSTPCILHLWQQNVVKDVVKLIYESDLIHIDLISFSASEVFISLGIAARKRKDRSVRKSILLFES